LDSRGRKCGGDGDEGNIVTREGESERKMVRRGILWTQERGSESRIVLGGIFWNQIEEVRGGWC